MFSFDFVVFYDLFELSRRNRIIWVWVNGIEDTFDFGFVKFRVVYGWHDIICQVNELVFC